MKRVWFLAPVASQYRFSSSLLCYAVVLRLKDVSIFKILKIYLMFLCPGKFSIILVLGDRNAIISTGKRW